MSRDELIKTLKENYDQNDEILLHHPDVGILTDMRVKVLSIDNYDEKTHRFIESDKKVIDLF